MLEEKRNKKEVNELEKRAKKHKRKQKYPMSIFPDYKKGAEEFNKNSTSINQDALSSDCSTCNSVAEDVIKNRKKRIEEEMDYKNQEDFLNWEIAEPQCTGFDCDDSIEYVFGDYENRVWIEQDGRKYKVFTSQAQEKPEAVFTSLKKAKEFGEKYWHDNYYYEDDMNESLNERFTNGTLEDWEPAELMRKVQETGEALHTIRTYGDNTYIITIFYKRWYGPRGIDNPDELYWADVVKEYPDGKQERVFSSRDLIAYDIIFDLMKWKRKELRGMNESLNEDNLNPEMRKDAKLQYKKWQNRRDRKKSEYDELLNLGKDFIKSGKRAFEDSESTSDDIKAYKKLKDKYSKKMDMWDEEHPFHLNKYRGIEREDYPFYVTVYDKTATYEPAEGGYYVEERYASNSKGFNTYEEAVADMNSYIEESGEDWQQCGKDCYEWSTKYIGDGQVIRIETNKDYLKGESHYNGYESFNKNRYKSIKKPVKMNESLNESDNGEKLGRWLGARLLSKWTAMLNVVGAETSPEYEFEESFDGNFVQCVKKLKEYQEIIDKNNLDAYLELESWNSGGSFTGDYDTIIDELYYRGYIYDDDFEDNEDIDESLDESCNGYSYKGKTIVDAGDYWFVKGYEEKFPTSDEAEEFVDDKKKDEGLEDKFKGPKPLESFDDVLKAEKNREKLYYYEDGVGNDDNPIPVVIAGRPNKFQIPLARLGVDEPYTFTIMDFRNLSRDKAGSLDKLANESMKINIRESLNKMDAESDNTYDLLNLYESKNLSKSQKKNIARMIYENYGLEKIYNYLYEATEESEESVEDRVNELTNNFKNTNGSYVFEEVQDANKAVSILKSKGYEASQKRTQDGKYRVNAEKKNK